MLCLSLSASLSLAQPSELSVGAKFSGVLVENLTPCSIREGDDSLQLRLSPMTLNDLTRAGETPRYPFSIHLENCSANPAAPVDIQVWLTGAGDSRGRLQLSPDSIAAGVVIGIENQQGTPLPLNAASPTLTLVLNGADVAIDMQAYLQLVDKHVLTAGAFSATLNYVIEYR